MNFHPKKLDLGGMGFMDENLLPKSGEEKMQRPGKGWEAMGAILPGKLRDFSGPTLQDSVSM